MGKEIFALYQYHVVWKTKEESKMALPNAYPSNSAGWAFIELIQGAWGSAGDPEAINFGLRKEVWDVLSSGGKWF